MVIPSSYEKAVNFANSMRGQLIMAQALDKAIEVMKAVQPEYLQEKSNIADMEYMQENLFSAFPPAIFKIKKEMNDD